MESNGVARQRRLFGKTVNGAKTDEKSGRRRRSKAPGSVHGRFKAAAIMLSAVVFASAGGGTFAYLRTRPLTTEQVAANVRPCIVGIIQYQKGRVGAYGEGSGIIMSQDGYIVTNNHVVEGANKLEVVTADGIKYEAKAIGSDARTDIAVVKISATGLKTAEFGDSGKCSVGEQVVAIGNPSGLRLAGSVTQGIISAKNREIDVGNGPMSLIQTDAAINPGNSGGALVNMKGQVIGINSAKIAQQGFEGIGFSIPISFAKPIIKSLIKYGCVKGRVKLGLNCQILDNITAGANNLPTGAYVEYVMPKSGAAAAGVKIGDVITGINNTRINSAGTFVIEMQRHKPGDKVKLTLFRHSTYSIVVLYVPLMEDRGGNAVGKAAGW